jgi:hypothetical protein
MEGKPISLSGGLLNFVGRIQGQTGQYVYHIKGQDTSEHLRKIGELMRHLLVELESNYAQEPLYQMSMRVFGEHFRVEEKVMKIKLGKELRDRWLRVHMDIYSGIVSYDSI